MCGIVGYIGNNNASKFLIEGLSKLEYRGYDSAGIAVVNNAEVSVVKHKGRLSNLTNELDKAPVWDGHTADDIIRLYSLLNKKED